MKMTKVGQLKNSQNSTIAVTIGVIQSFLSVHDNLLGVTGIQNVPFLSATALQNYHQSL